MEFVCLLLFFLSNYTFRKISLYFFVTKAILISNLLNFLWLLWAIKYLFQFSASFVRTALEISLSQYGTLQPMFDLFSRNIYLSKRFFSLMPLSYSLKRPKLSFSNSISTNCIWKDKKRKLLNLSSMFFFDNLSFLCPFQFNWCEWRQEYFWRRNVYSIIAELLSLQILVKCDRQTRWSCGGNVEILIKFKTFLLLPSFRLDHQSVRDIYVLFVSTIFRNDRTFRWKYYETMRVYTNLCLESCLETLHEIISKALSSFLQYWMWKLWQSRRKPFSTFLRLFTTLLKTFRFLLLRCFWGIFIAYLNYSNLCWWFFRWLLYYR